MARRDDDDLAPDALAPKPGDEGSRAITGILGESSDDEFVRIYLDLEFTRSYDVPRDAIVRRATLAAEQSPLGVECSIVWVRADTVLRVRHVETRRLEAEFLAGDFTLPTSFTPLAENAQLKVAATLTIRCASLDGPDVAMAICRTSNASFPSCAWKCPSEPGPVCPSGGCPPRTWGGVCYTRANPSCWEVC